MRRLMLFITICLVSFLMTMPSVSEAAPADEAKQAKLTVNVVVERPDVFWNCTFVTKDDFAIGKPAKVVVRWSIGSVPKNEKTETVLVTGKELGKLEIIADKQALVNIEALIYTAKNERIGSIGIQVQNKGQNERIAVAPPETILPQFIWGGE